MVILITAEFLPKVFFQIYSNKLIKILALPAYLFYLMFSFISDFVIWISDMILKQFFKTEGDQLQLAFTKVELGNYISEQMESVEDHEEVDTEIQIFQNALRVFRSKSREVMVPRTEIIAVEVNNSIKTLMPCLQKQVVPKYWFIKKPLMIFWVMCILLNCLKNPKI